MLSPELILYKTIIFLAIKIKKMTIIILGDILKKFILILLVTFGIAVIPSLFVGNSVEGLIKPLFYPPNILFPIVWTILYFLISISFYVVSKEDNPPYKIYFLQLIVNSLWTVIFFGLKLRLLAFFWLMLLIILVAIMFVKFYNRNKKSAYLLVPYMIWLVFAGYLNLAIYLLNR